MSLADQITADVSAVFMDTADFAVSITYKRGTASATLTAMVDQTAFPMFNDIGSTRVEQRVFLIEASTLDLGSGVTLPKVGDKITQGSNVYVIPHGESRPAYEYQDENRLLLRVYTTLQSGT